MNPEQLAFYLEHKGVVCPFCKLPNTLTTDGQIDYGSDVNHTYQSVRCGSCDEFWTDEFTLTGVTEAE